MNVNIKSYIMNTITNKFVIQGTYDIKNNVNKNGTARNILDLIIQFRTYPSVYDEIEAGFYPTDTNYILEIAIRYATKGGHFDMVRYFISIYKPTSEYYDDCCYSTANLCNCHHQLHSYIMKELYIGAAMGNHKNYIDHLLLTYKNCSGEKYKHILHGAIISNNLELFKLYYPYCHNEILGNAFSLTITDELSHYAAIHNRIEILDYLMPIESTSKRDYGYLIMTASSHGIIDILKYALEKGAEGMDSTYYEAAVRKGHLEYVRCCLENKCDLSWTRCLKDAIRRDNSKMCQLLIEYGAEISNLAINQAIYYKSKKVLKTLLVMSKCKDLEKYLYDDDKDIQMVILTASLYINIE
jgi:hypothetical protein